MKTRFRPISRLTNFDSAGEEIVYQQVDIPLDDLLLDPENPRTGTVKSQPSALRAIIMLSTRNFKTMMESIKEHGLDPGDLFYLVDESPETGIEGYTVIDGNRRLGALQVLRQPTLLAGTELSESITKRLREAAEGFESSAIGETRTCVLFDSRADAEDWILRRHGRDLNGEERISWGPLDIQRFQGDRSILDVIDFVQKHAGYSSEQWATVKAKIDRSSYVLRRFLESKAGKEFLGLDEVEEGKSHVPTSSMSPVYLARALKRIFDDIVAGAIDTRKYNKATQIKEYFDELPAELKSKHEDHAGTKKIRDLTVGAETSEEASKEIKDKKSNPVKLRNTLDPKQLEFVQPVNAKGQQFIRESTKVDLKSAPLSAAFLLRGFIQFAVDLYMLNNNIPFWENNNQLDLHVRADRVIDHLVSAKKAKRNDLSGIKRRLAERANKNPSSIQALNDYHHDQYQVPDPDALRTGWDEATALFVAIFGRVV